MSNAHTSPCASHNKGLLSHSSMAAFKIWKQTVEIQSSFNLMSAFQKPYHLMCTLVIICQDQHLSLSDILR